MWVKEMDTGSEGSLNVSLSLSKSGKGKQVERKKLDRNPPEEELGPSSSGTENLNFLESLPKP